MVDLARKPKMASQVVRDATIMSGAPVVRGTRVPALTIVAYLRAGRSDQEVFEDYPTLPVDGIEAVREWAQAELGESFDEVANRPTIARS